MSTKLWIPLCAAAALMAGCADRNNDADTTNDTGGTANDSASGAAGDTSPTTPDKTAPDATTPGTTTPDTTSAPDNNPPQSPGGG